MHVGVLTVEGHIPASFSLKDKRRVIRSGLDKLRNRLNLSVAEVGRQDDPRFTRLAVAGVGSSLKVVEKELAEALRLLESTDGLEILDQFVTFV
ncbi:DUF503 domain-containing protein [Staphylospora marina]|uniref:DUF503 domain-containing protein n=1 Tax=Staphylospora marina TaxID=2490858 RepID=UPI000F5BFA3F|nr:DUF503 domain-containing protein [Staphylospora marina]